RAACSGAKRAWTASRIFAFSLLREIQERSGEAGAVSDLVGAGCEWLHAARARRSAAEKVRIGSCPRPDRRRGKTRGSTLKRFEGSRSVRLPGLRVRELARGQLPRLLPQLGRPLP